MKVIFLLLASVSITRAADPVEPFGSEICRLFADGVELRSPGTCQDYVTCQNGKSIVSSCEADKLFDKDSTKSDKCVKNFKSTYCNDPCDVKTTKTYLKDPKTCNGYYRCNNGTGTFGACGSTFLFDEKTQSCIYPEDSACNGYAYCDVVPNNVNFKDETSCDMYYTCKSGKLSSSRCVTGYYHPQQGCTKKTEVNCPVHPIPFEVCGTDKRPIRNKFVNDQRTCRGYMYCIDKGDNIPDLSPVWGQCPSGYFFDFSQQACYTASEVRCDENRCDGQNRAKVISGTPGCQHYLLCSGDDLLGEEQCGNGMYFDDKSMSCTTEVRKYGSCS